MIGAKMSWVDLGGSSLTDCQFTRSELFGANLSNSDLTGSDFTRAYSEANLSGCTLGDANLDYADLTGANLRNTKMNGARLVNVFLNEAEFIWSGASPDLTLWHDPSGTVWSKAKFDRPA